MHSIFNGVYTVEISLSQLTGVGAKTLANLNEAGINSIDDILKSRN
jgi:predicted flap endonuclease-1-like 5' DNA nuclease